MELVNMNHFYKSVMKIYEDFFYLLVSLFEFVYLFNFISANSKSAMSCHFTTLLTVNIHSFSAFKTLDKLWSKMPFAIKKIIKTKEMKLFYLLIFICASKTPLKIITLLIVLAANI